MKFYSYSVKKAITDYFGNDAVTAMRITHETAFSQEEKSSMIPLSWQYADLKALRLFDNDKFIVDTITEDDYIAYLYRKADKRCAFLMFMLCDDDAPFSIDINYAREIIGKWQTIGYDTKILVIHITTEECAYKHGFCFTEHKNSDYIYELTEINGKFFQVFDIQECWQAYYNKLVCASAQNDIREYECLFEPTISIEEENGRENHATGIKAAADYIRKNGPLRIAYAEYGNTGMYSKIAMLGNRKISFTVNCRNLISSIKICSLPENKIIYLDSSDNIKSMIYSVPTLENVRVLNIAKLHGYAVQLSYSNGSIRNYYLKTFEEPQIPSLLDIDGYTFDSGILNSVSIKNNGICFSNGYSISSHLLYYRSYRQVQPVITEHECYRAGDSVLKLKYILPLREYKNCFAAQPSSFGQLDECFGPADAVLDCDGNRITDVSVYGYNGNNQFNEICIVSVEPTRLFGVIKSDGTWFAPPVYESVEKNINVFLKAKRKVDGTVKSFIITSEGKEIPCDSSFDIPDRKEYLLPFNECTEPISAPMPENVWDDNISVPGNWGYKNIYGEIVVKPQYVYAFDFHYDEDTPAIVAKLIDGELFWGAVDKNGTEVIPCVYDLIYTYWGDAFAFRRKGENLVGVMDLNGNVIAQPEFKLFKEYDVEHKMLTVGLNEYSLGVYSLELHKLIIPMDYDNIEYDEGIISCEIPYTCEEKYFNYSGEELDFSQYDCVSVTNGLLRTIKNGKCGFMDFDGKILYPNIFVDGFYDYNIKLYKKGYIITENRKFYGLSTVDGREILPPIYKSITAYENFVITSEHYNGSGCVSNLLYTYEGTPVFKGAYRNMRFSEERQELTVETPRGIEHYRLISGNIT